MSLYRIKQFYWSVTSKMNSDDEQLVNKFLNDKEKHLFYCLSTFEQKHSINVVRDVIKTSIENKINNEALIKAAMLHDIGKTYKKLSPMGKSIMVILDNMSKGKIKKYKGLKAVDVYYNHGDKGYNILKNIGGYDERFLYLIKNHHNDFIIGDKELNLLRACDSKN